MKKIIVIIVVFCTIYLNINHHLKTEKIDKHDFKRVVCITAENSSFSRTEDFRNLLQYYTQNLNSYEFIYTSASDSVKEINIIREVLNLDVDYLIIELQNLNYQNELEKLAKEKNTKVIYIYNQVHSSYPEIYINNQKMIDLQVSYAKQYNPAKLLVISYPGSSYSNIISSRFPTSELKIVTVETDKKEQRKDLIELLYYEYDSLILCEDDLIASSCVYAMDKLYLHHNQIIGMGGYDLINEAITANKILGTINYDEQIIVNYVYNYIMDKEVFDVELSNYEINGSLPMQNIIEGEE